MLPPSVTDAALIEYLLEPPDRTLAPQVVDEVVAIRPETGIVVVSIRKPRPLEEGVRITVSGTATSTDGRAGSDERSPEDLEIDEHEYRIRATVVEVRDSGELLVLEISNEHAIKEWDSFEVFRDGKLITRVLVRKAVADDPKKEFLRLDGGDELHVGDVVGLEVYEKK